MAGRGRGKEFTSSEGDVPIVRSSLIILEQIDTVLVPRQHSMVVGERLRGVREKKNLSQGDVEKRTGLLRCYISRVENGHTVPSVGTLEKLARALEVPLYQLFYDGEKPPKIPNSLMKSGSVDVWGSTGKDADYCNKLRRLLNKIGEGDRKLVLHMAQKMANR